MLLLPLVLAAAAAAGRRRDGAGKKNGPYVPATFRMVAWLRGRKPRATAGRSSKSRSSSSSSSSPEAAGRGKATAEGFKEAFKNKAFKVPTFSYVLVLRSATLTVTL